MPLPAPLSPMAPPLLVILPPPPAGPAPGSPLRPPLPPWHLRRRSVQPARCRLSSSPAGATPLRLGHARSWLGPPCASSVPLGLAPGSGSLRQLTWLAASLTASTTPCRRRRPPRSATSRRASVTRPRPSKCSRRPCGAPNPNHAGGDGSFSYFAKQLTQSDANNGGGFSVPRFCADFIFPKLDFEADPPVQKLLMRDLRGKPWEFRHIYRGTPRRHLLTTGWSKFVNAKLLVAGDTVVFMRRPEGELLVGVRRAPRFPVSLQATGPLRNARARVPPQEVLDAARLAAEGRPFTVTYYPRQGAGEFVVPRKEAEDAINSTTWEPGVQVRMQVMEAEDSRRSDWASGTVKAVDPSIIWRMLEIDWDDSTSSSSTKSRHVNAWQVQFAGYPPLLKRLRISEGIPPPCSGNGAIADPLMAPESQSMAILLGSPIPAGMQGARHNGPTDVPSSSATMFTTQLLFPGDLQIPPSLSGGSSEIVNPENESPPNNSVNMHPSDLPDEMRSIQLFGTTITSPVQSANNGSFEEVNQVPNGVVDGTANEDASATSPLDWSLSKDDGHNQNDSRQGA